MRHNLQKVLTEMQRLQQRELEMSRSHALLQKEVEMSAANWNERNRLLDSKILIMSCLSLFSLCC